LNGATWLSGTTVPSGALGVQNDFYINTSNGDYYKKTGFTTWTFQTNLTGPTGPQGPAGPQGVQGIQGLTGQTGAQGIQGVQGSAGTNGNNGVNGTAWLSGTTLPSGSSGVQNDFYINTSTGDYYKKTGSTTWTLQANLTGPAGPQGTQGVQGLTGPTGATGPNGIDGANGATWLSGTTSPTTSLGSVNDFYINTSNGDYYKKTGSSTWTLQANLTGPAGQQGTSSLAFIKSYKIDETSSGQIPYWDLLSFSLEPNSSIEIDYDLTSIASGGYHTCQIWVDTITDEIQMGTFDEASNQVPSSWWMDTRTTNARDSVIIKNVSNTTRNYHLRLNKNSTSSSTIKVRVICRKFS
jgi:nitrate reductase NapE component